MYYNYSKISVRLLMQQQRQQQLLLSSLVLFQKRLLNATTLTPTRLQTRNLSSFIFFNTTTTARQREQQQQQQQEQLIRTNNKCNTTRMHFHTSVPIKHGNTKFPDGTPQVSLTFIDPKKPIVEEQSITVKAYVGDNLLRVAHKNAIDLEGACEGACACSTCHVILEQDVYDKCDEPSEDEEDMLDMAFDLQETSRLGCQIVVSEEMDGTTITLPSATRDFYVDGHIPKPH